MTTPIFYLLRASAPGQSFNGLQFNGAAPANTIATAWHCSSGEDNTGNSCMMDDESYAWIVPPPVFPLAGGVLSGTVHVINGSVSYTPSGLPYVIPTGTIIEFASQSGVLYYGGQITNRLERIYNGPSNIATTVTIHVGGNTQSEPTYPVGETPYGMFGTGAITASFASATWAFSFNIISPSLGGIETTGTFAVRVWKGSSANGSDAVEITSSAIVSNNLTWNAGSQVITALWSAPAITCSGEYLFFAVAIVGGSYGAGQVTLYQDPSSFILTNNSPVVPAGGVTKSPVVGVGVVVTNHLCNCTGVTDTLQLGVSNNTVKTYSSGIKVSSVPGVGEGFGGCLADGYGTTSLAILGSGYAIQSISGHQVSPQIGVGGPVPVPFGKTVHPTLGTSYVTVATDASGYSSSPTLGSSVVHITVQAVGLHVSPTLGQAVLTVTGDCYGTTVSPRVGVQDSRVIVSNGQGSTSVRKLGIGHAFADGFIYCDGKVSHSVHGAQVIEVATAGIGATVNPTLGVTTNALTTGANGSTVALRMGIEDCQVITQSVGPSVSPVLGTMAYSSAGAVVSPVQAVPSPPTSNGFGSVAITVVGIAYCQVIANPNGTRIDSAPGLPYCSLGTTFVGVTDDVTSGSGRAVPVSRTKVLDVVITLE